MKNMFTALEIILLKKALLRTQAEVLKLTERLEKIEKQEKGNDSKAAA